MKPVAAHRRVSVTLHPARVCRHVPALTAQGVAWGVSTTGRISVLPMPSARCVLFGGLN